MPGFSASNIIEEFSRKGAAARFKGSLPPEDKIMRSQPLPVTPREIVLQIESIASTLIQHLPSTGKIGNDLMFAPQFNESGEELLDNLCPAEVKRAARIDRGQLQ